MAKRASRAPELGRVLVVLCSTAGGAEEDFCIPEERELDDPPAETPAHRPWALDPPSPR
jgi:hypothetical protein